LKFITVTHKNVGTHYLIDTCQHVKWGYSFLKAALQHTWVVTREWNDSCGRNFLSAIVQLDTRNFGHHCQYTVKKCKIGFTYIIFPFATILIDMRMTWTENEFQNLTFKYHVDNKEWFTSQLFEVTEKWCPKFRVPNRVILYTYRHDRHLEYLLVKTRYKNDYSN
jgi:hypothetical protein